MTMDVTKAIEPRSDQQNADSLMAGPRTIRIRDIKYNAEADMQPLWVYFDGDDDKPWKPCRTAARCLVQVWGPDAKKWIGLHCTIYNDPDVSFGGAKVGGIRVSHMEGLTSPRTLMLTKTRGKKGATVIKPLVVEKTKEANKKTEAPDSTTIDTDTLFQDARDNAELGKDAMREWWATKSKEEQAAMKSILGELQETAAKADAATD